MSDDTLRNAMPSDRAAGRIEESAERLRDEAQRTAGHLKDAGKSEAEARMDQAGSGLGTTAERLRSAASELEGKDAWIGTLLERTADTADKAGRYLSGQDLNDVVSDAQSLGRRNPGAFLGGAAALGFVLARAGRATVERTDTDRIARAAKGDDASSMQSSSLSSADRTGRTSTGQTGISHVPAVAPKPATLTSTSATTPPPVTARTDPNGGNI